MDGEQQHIESAETGQGSTAAVPETASPRRKMPFEKLVYYGLTALTFLLPIFVIPSATVPQDASKAWLLGIAAIVLGALYLVGFLMGEKTPLPKNLLFLGTIAVALSALISGVFSPVPSVSLLGFGYHVGTASTIGFLAIIMYLALYAYSNRSRIFSFYLTLLASFLVVALFQIIRLIFGADALSFGLFTQASFSPVGKWNDLAVFSGLILVLSTISLYYFRTQRFVRIAGIVAIIIALYFLTIIDFWILWLILAAVLLIFFLSSSWENVPDTGKRRFVLHSASYLTLGIIVYAALFGYLLRFPMGDTTIVSSIASNIGGSPYAEIVLPPGPTLDITLSALKEDPLFGIGPNRFSQAYFLDKPEGINSTALWDSSFDAGFSHLMTFVATNGLLGLLAWLTFIAGLLLAIRKTFALKGKDHVAEYIGISSAFMALYLWTVTGFYLPNIALLAIAFLSAGILLAALTHENIVGTRSFGIPDKNGWGVASVPIVALSIIGLLVWGYFFTGVLRADMHFQNARSLANKGSIKDAMAEGRLAIAISERDAYDRLLTDLQLLDLQRVLGEVPSSEDQLRRNIQELTSGATQSADAAIAMDKTNYLNHISKATIADLLATIGVEGAANTAKASYADALIQNPKSPRIYFALARMELLSKNAEGAKLNLKKTLELRPNYPEAVAAFAELERQGGNMDSAIDAATRGLQSDPNNFVIAFQLGFLYYAQEKYPQAISALESAAATNPYYADAKYFLGISYARTNQKEKALKQFEDVHNLNPENKEIERVIRNLNAGRDPLVDGN